MHIHIISLFLPFLPWLHIMIYGNHDLHPPTPPLNVSFFFARLQETSSWSWLVGFPRHVDFSKHPPGWLNSRFFMDLTLISWW